MFFMINGFYNKLLSIELEFHEIASSDSESIVLHAKSLDAEGIFEVMRIKELADKFRLQTKWDGQDIEITR
jgi:hypothetical protein